MCLLVAAIIFLLAFYLAGEIQYYQLNEVIGEVSIPLADSWEILNVLWPAMAMMFFVGVLAVLLVMKLIPNQADNQESESNQ